MDCCNYIEPYFSGSGHFYQAQQQQLQIQQQQHYFCYESLNGSGVGGHAIPNGDYQATPISNTIDTSMRYNNTGGTFLPPTTSLYTTDYVYNPKEARLRKAMREQNREISRRSVLQNAIGNAGRTSVAELSSPSPTSYIPSQQQLQPRFGSITSNVSQSPVMGTSQMLAHRHHSNDTWFGATNLHHSKTTLSPRLGDWYEGSIENNSSDGPIERLQAMGTIHRHPFEKSLSKSSLRNQIPLPITDRTSARFSTNHYQMNNYPDTRDRDNFGEYPVDFGDVQKWHPYQNGSSPHSRITHPPVLHPGFQNANLRNHVHLPWGQFCHSVLPHVPTVMRNMNIRGPPVFLRDRLANRNCGFMDETIPSSYGTEKIDIIDNMRKPYYSTSENQVPKTMESPKSKNDSHEEPSAPISQDEESEESKWESTTIPGSVSLENCVLSSSLKQETGTKCVEQPEQMRFNVCPKSYGSQSKSSCKQPLPGFHQAFGSTEIGKFSRSEFFVNMVGENSIGRVESENVSENCDTLETNGETAVANDVTAAATVVITTSKTDTTKTTSSLIKRTFNEGIGCSFNEQVLLASPMSPYRGPPTVPKWHSPHVDPIGSEI